ncbi:saccharopine dehydrogenase-like oxidoreductase [Haliotis rubra]|uniref:saccharopine dehydrogenase-like oxidoreductase n=1 Tax=Haliotis rubra TaxID=36100 RepID=UPI001EE5F008|nr:saccharopine dehydrogenase-like oxidoreductase [Haliotis rubra]
MSTGESARKYDIVIFGATGFTGQFVVDEVARIAEEEGVTWAVAGRKMDRLQKVLEQSGQRTGKTLEDTPIIIADSSAEQSILDMCKQARVVLNCVGPYRFHGNQVVRACIEGGASHIDISGEPQFLENMQLLYNTKAKEAGIYIVGSCGFDSIPADLGIVFLKSKFQGDLNSVECYVSLKSGPEGAAINYATYESAVHGFAHQGELPDIRKQLFPSPLPRSKHKAPRRSETMATTAIHRGFTVLGSDKSVVTRTQRYNYDVKKSRPIQFSPYLCIDSFLYMVLMVVFGTLFGLFAKFSITRSILLQFPGLFTVGLVKKGGPSKKQIEGTSFSMTFFGEGYSDKLDDPEAQHETPPDKKIQTKVIGPEPGYVTTPICMVQSGLMILKEKSKLPSDGGVYTPGAAFGETSLITRLDKRNVKFQVLES